MACVLHLPERTYCSPYFNHLPSEGKEILLAIQGRNAYLNVLATGMVHLTLGASVFLKPLADCPKVVTDRPEDWVAERENWATFSFRLTLVHTGNPMR